VSNVTNAAVPFVEEKREARFKAKASQAVQDRISRALQQRMFLLSRKTVSNHHHEFAVLGSTGNVYTVHVRKISSCDCPDFGKGNLCKHILFVYLKVLRVDSDSYMIYQTALLTSELEEIFNGAMKVDPTVLAGKKVIASYKRHVSGTGEDEEGGEDDDGGVKQRALEGSCPICFEDFEESDKTKVVWCTTSCGNNIHTTCFQNWKAATEKKGEKATCVYCRAVWITPGAVDKSGKGKGKRALEGEEGYLNLGDVARLPSERDTSSYSEWAPINRRRWRGW
ncbi:hypothetical protein HDU76_003203, partial [Blyttiomyces sp. JEL0837]